MENLIEKLKGLDKKVWIGIGIGAAVVIILIVALIIGSGNDKPSGSTQGSSQGNSQVGTQTGTQAGTEGIGTENLGTEVLGTEMTTEIETEISTETEMTESESQSQVQDSNQGGNTVTQPEDVDGVEQTPVTTTPDGEEILGVGTADTPYEVIPDLDTMTVTTIEIPAGKTIYYAIQRVGGMWFEISDSDLYVIDSVGNRHDSGFVVENAMPNENVLFQIGNKSGSAKSFTLKFANIKGSWENPEVLNGNGPFTKHLNAGDEIGYWYSVTATKTGTVRIYMSATEDSELTVQNTDPNVTIGRKLTEDAQSDAKGTYVEMPVTAGEEIRIHVQGIKPVRGSVPATDITFEFVY